MTVQLYWFNKAFDVAERQFDHTVQVALKKVADSLSAQAEVKKLSSNFFFVSTGSLLEDEQIDSLLKKEFALRSLAVDYELGVYNATDDTLVYGKYVEASQRKWLETKFGGQVNPGERKNFAVLFPSKTSFLAGQLNIWIFSTIALLLMMLFFAYAIASLLRERKFADLKTDFINNMTHEFKTPVTNIGIAAEVLKSKFKNDPNAHVYLDILLKENQKLRDKIDKVLLSASVPFHTSETFTTLDVHQLIRECAETFQMKVNERNGSLMLDLGSSSSQILGDRELLTQAISNVIDNAEKYSHDAPRIVITTQDRKDGLEISVRDAGIGISSEMKAKVFEKFFRVRTGYIHNVKGFGLGLNFVREVVAFHRGRVSLNSEVNAGTEIKIFLPAP